MKKETIIYLITLATILLVRASIFVWPNHHIIIAGFLIHHFWIGLLLILITLTIPEKYSVLRIIVCGIGLGLFIDEFTFIILGGGLDVQYWQFHSYAGPILIMALLFLIRKRISGFLSINPENKVRNKKFS